MSKIQKKAAVALFALCMAAVALAFGFAFGGKSLSASTAPKAIFDDFADDMVMLNKIDTDIAQKDRPIDVYGPDSRWQGDENGFVLLCRDDSVRVTYAVSGQNRAVLVSYAGLGSANSDIKFFAGSTRETLQPIRYHKKTHTSVEDGNKVPKNEYEVYFDASAKFFAFSFDQNSVVNMGWDQTVGSLKIDYSADAPSTVERADENYANYGLGGALDESHNLFVSYGDHGSAEDEDYINWYDFHYNYFRLQQNSKATAADPGWFKLRTLGNTHFMFLGLERSVSAGDEPIGFLFSYLKEDGSEVSIPAADVVRTFYFAPTAGAWSAAEYNVYFPADAFELKVTFRSEIAFDQQIGGGYGNNNDPATGGHYMLSNNASRPSAVLAPLTGSVDKNKIKITSEQFGAAELPETATVSANLYDSQGKFLQTVTAGRTETTPEGTADNEKKYVLSCAFEVSEDGAYSVRYFLSGGRSEAEGTADNLTVSAKTASPSVTKWGVKPEKDGIVLEGTCVEGASIEVTMVPEVGKAIKQTFSPEGTSFSKTIDLAYGVWQVSVRQIAPDHTYSDPAASEMLVGTQSVKPVLTSVESAAAKKQITVKGTGIAGGTVEVFVKSADYELSRKERIGADGTFTVTLTVKAGRSYTVTARQRGTETESVFGEKAEWAQSIAMPKLPALDLPEPPVVTGKTDTSVTVEQIAGMLYKLCKKDGTVVADWQTSNVFANLTGETEYVVTAKYAETDEFLASEVSEGTAVTTEKTKPAEETPNGGCGCTNGGALALVGLLAAAAIVSKKIF